MRLNERGGRKTRSGGRWKIGLAPHITAGERLLRPLERRLGARGVDEAADEPALSGHVLIVGFGLAGQTLAKAFRAQGTAYAVLEMNAERVRKARADGVPIWYADATSPEAMHHAGVTRAAAVVLLINDSFAARRAVHSLRAIAPHTPVLVRCRYDSERSALHELGAVEVVVEEVEAATEMLRRTRQTLAARQGPAGDLAS